MNDQRHDWSAANRHRIDRDLDVIRAALAGESVEWMAAGDGLDPPARLDSLAATFDLGADDLVVLLLALAVELSPGALEGRPSTVALAIELGGDDVLAAVCPQAPLRRWRLIELAGGGAMPDRVVKLDERILYHLLGVDYLDARLDGLVARGDSERAPSTGEAALVERLAPVWRSDENGWPALQLCGALEPGRAVAAALCAGQGRGVFRLQRGDVPRAAHERLALARLCDRELALSGGALVIEGDGGEDDDRAAAAFVDALLGPAIVIGRDPLGLRRARRLRADLPSPTVAERRALWRATLAGQALPPGDVLDRLAEQFTLDGTEMRAVADLAASVGGEGWGGEGGHADRLWDGARAQARRRLDDLAERVEARAAWDDLVLPADRLDQLRDITVHIRRGWQVHGDWGFAARGGGGLGVTALFAGASGTGKTMAAEVLAGALRLDLYRIDLSQVVSKYIGETEKNLRRVFESAEQGGAILLFDEADALFGKRSDVKDSHDRHANVEVSYLLQRMEAYRGLAILTTNLKHSLDPAFMRRLRFVVDFPFPDLATRAAIWRRVFPAATPLAVDPARMARLAVAGGTIRTIAINAAFLAAEAGEPVGLAHLSAAARREYAKLDKPITAAEFGGLE